MNSAELVNLIIAKLRRVEVLVIQNLPFVTVRFRWGGNQYTAMVCVDDSIDVYRWVGQDECRCDNYKKYVQDILNGKVRNDAGEMVKPC